MKSKDIKEFLSLDLPCLDVRSPLEYANGHIPNAVSFPLFSDNERAQVGTQYKLRGHRTAVKLGLSIVGCRLTQMIEKVEALNSDRFKIYCMRGGMRSASISWLLHQVDFKVIQLNLGYKNYRAFIMDQFAKPYKMRILAGMTGTGKTEVLNEMSRIGAQVLDLEGLANHPGSSFGNQLENKQPTTEMFQNNIHHQLDKFDLNKPIWVEDESICIGSVHLPYPLFQQMRDGTKINIEIPKKKRLKRLVKHYGHLPPEKLIKATLAIGKKLGKQSTDKAVAYIRSEELLKAAEIILTYYDRNYIKGSSKSSSKILDFSFSESTTTKDIAKFLIGKNVG